MGACLPLSIYKRRIVIYRSPGRSSDSHRRGVRTHARGKEYCATRRANPFGRRAANIACTRVSFLVGSLPLRRPASVRVTVVSKNRCRHAHHLLAIHYYPCGSRGSCGHPLAWSLRHLPTYAIRICEWWRETMHGDTRSRYQNDNGTRSDVVAPDALERKRALERGTRQTRSAASFLPSFLPSLHSSFLLWRPLITLSCTSPLKIERRRGRRWAKSHAKRI